jgi:pSer/pThr/pTyr-binding forkhead associated (FHA) protein
MGMKIILRHQNNTSDNNILQTKNFDTSMVTIGSDPSSTLIIEGIAIEQACLIEENGETILINHEDGTLLNNRALSKGGRYPIKIGDTLTIADYIIDLVSNEESLPEETKSNGQTNRRFTEILESLRTDEDNYHFVIRGTILPKKRIPILSSEMTIGFDESIEDISFNVDKNSKILAKVDKSWNGIFITPEEEAIIKINGKPIEFTTRLNDGDTLSFKSKLFRNKGYELIFHEPTLVIALDSLFPQGLPEPVNLPSLISSNAPPSKIKDEHVVQTAPIPNTGQLSTYPYGYFGAFSASDLFLLFIGTMTASLVVYLVLHLSA